MPTLERMDPELVNRGRWEEWPRVPGIRVRVAMLGNPAYQARLAELIAEHADEIVEGKLSPELDRALALQANAETLFLEFEGLVDDRVPFREQPPEEEGPGPVRWVNEDGCWKRLMDNTLENRLYLLSCEDYFEFATWVLRLAQKRTAFRRQLVDATRKNSEPSLPGGSGMGGTPSTSSAAARPSAPAPSSTRARKSPPTRSAGSRGSATRPSARAPARTASP